MSYFDVLSFVGGLFGNCIQINLDQLQLYFYSEMPGKKKKQIKEPDVTVPAGDPKIGKSIFDEQCATCHGLEGDGKGAAAPPLGGIIGRQAGTTAFSYSKAMKSSGIIWSAKHIFVYVTNPGKHIPGNKMSYAGMSGETEKAHLIAYLESV